MLFNNSVLPSLQKDRIVAFLNASSDVSKLLSLYPTPFLSTYSMCLNVFRLDWYLDKCYNHVKLNIHNFPNQKKKCSQEKEPPSGFTSCFLLITPSFTQHLLAPHPQTPHGKSRRHALLTPIPRLLMVNQEDMFL